MKHETRKKKSHFTLRIRGLSALLALILFACATLYLPLTVNALGYVGVGDISKIEDDLLMRLDASNDRMKTFCVDVRLWNISSDSIASKLQNTYGFKMEEYEKL